MNNLPGKTPLDTGEIMKMLGKLPYPAEFLERYEIIEPLARKEGSETFLVRGKSDGVKYIAKCYTGGNRALSREDELLRGLSFEGLPKYAASYENDRVFISVREYIEGIPLDKYAEKTLPTARAAEITKAAVLPGKRFPADASSEELKAWAAQFC